MIGNYITQEFLKTTFTGGGMRKFMVAVACLLCIVRAAAADLGQMPSEIRAEKSDEIANFKEGGQQWGVIAPVSPSVEPNPFQDLIDIMQHEAQMLENAMNEWDFYHNGEVIDQVVDNPNNECH